MAGDIAHGRVNIASILRRCEVRIGPRVKSSPSLSFARIGIEMTVQSGRMVGTRWRHRMSWCNYLSVVGKMVGGL